MKKKFIFIILLIVIFICLISGKYFRKGKIKQHNDDIKVLLKAPDISKNNTTDTNENSYELLDEYTDGSENKKEKSMDFISKISKETNNPYNIDSVSTDSSFSNCNDDVMLLARLIESEAGNQNYMGKLAVGSVVLNRCKSNGESLSSVIYASKQFSGINTQSFFESPSSDSINAAKETLNGKDVISNAYYYANLNLCSPDFAIKDKFIERIGNHWFFKK